MAKQSKHYQTGFSSGTLLSREFNAVLSGFQDFNDLKVGIEAIPLSIIPVNAESSRKRYMTELKKRLVFLSNDLFISYKEASDTGKQTILFFLACKCYDLIAEFMIQVVREKWLNMDKTLSVSDFQGFLYEKSDHDPSLVSLTENTRGKLAQVLLKMLKELGMLNNGRLQKIEYDISILYLIARQGDRWFLDVMLLNDAEKKRIAEL